MLTSMIFAAATTALLPQRSATEKVTLEVEGVKREFLIYVPRTKDARPRPVVFAFHGHGGNMNYSVRKFKFNETWPQAISVYPQGLPTKGMTDPEGKKNGWQQRAGTEGDRDVKFFDAMLEYVKKGNIVDEKNIFSMGHSNGGAMTMALWNARGSLLKGVGICAGGGRAPAGTPVAAFFSSGKNDPIVKFPGQRLSVQAAKRANGSQGDGTAWGENTTRWEGTKPLVWYVDEGGHELPEPALAKLTQFFKELAGQQ